MNLGTHSCMSAFVHKTSSQYIYVYYNTCSIIQDAQIQNLQLHSCEICSNKCRSIVLQNYKHKHNSANLHELTSILDCHTEKTMSLMVCIKTREEVVQVLYVMPSRCNTIFKNFQKLFLILFKNPSFWAIIQTFWQRPQGQFQIFCCFAIVSALISVQQCERTDKLRSWLKPYSAYQNQTQLFLPSH